MTSQTRGSDYDLLQHRHGDEYSIVISCNGGRRRQRRWILLAVLISALLALAGPRLGSVTQAFGFELPFWQALGGE